jgi:hypothetical protein
LTSIPEGFSPTVGGSLDLRGLTSIPEGFSPTVGGSLYLRGLTSIPEGFSPTVGGSLYLSGLTSTQKYKLLPENYIFSWQNEKYVKIDGIFAEVICKKKNVYKLKKIGGKIIFYCVSDGFGNWSHGSTIKEAKEDLIYKITNKNKNDYLELTLDSAISFEDAIKCYRVVTGSCQFGVKDFIKNRLCDVKKGYKISEIIELTQGEYGHNAFSSFFKK